MIDSVELLEQPSGCISYLYRIIHLKFVSSTETLEAFFPLLVLASPSTSQIFKSADCIEEAALLMNVVVLQCVEIRGNEDWKVLA